MLARDLRQRAVADLRGHVVEIGAGGGANFPYYRKARKVVAVEPDAKRRRTAARRAHRARVPITLVDARAESLPFPDHCFDAAVLSLVLCSVDDVARALSEVQRVVRRGGRVRVVEHVCARQRSIAVLQAWLTRLLCRLGGTCHLDRCTLEALYEAGFTVKACRVHLGGLLIEVRARTPSAPDTSRPPTQGGARAGGRDVSMIGGE